MTLLEEIQKAIKKGLCVETNTKTQPGDEIIGEMNREDKALYFLAKEYEERQDPKTHNLLVDLMWFGIEKRFPDAGVIALREGYQIVALPPQKKSTMIRVMICSEMD